MCEHGEGARPRDITSQQVFLFHMCQYGGTFIHSYDYDYDYDCDTGLRLRSLYTRSIAYI